MSLIHYSKAFYKFKDPFKNIKKGYFFESID